MTLESGPAKADRNWQILRAVLFLGFALWFIYDGAVRYPAKTRAEAEKKLLAPEPFGGELKYDDLRDTPTKAIFDRLHATNPRTIEQVRQQLGEPQVKRSQGIGRSIEYYVSRYGYAIVEVNGTVVSPNTMTWNIWYKTKEQIKSQFLWAIIPGLPGLWFLWRIYKAATLRVVIDDQGMTYDRRRIPFEAMAALRDYSPKGWIDLYYKDGDQEKKLRLDNEKVLLFDEIVAAICQAKGFPNEVTAYAEEKARAAEEQKAAERLQDQDEDTPPDDRA